MATILKLLLLLLGTFLGVALALLATMILGDLILPIACILFLAIIGGFYIWIIRGGLKRSS